MDARKLPPTWEAVTLGEALDSIVGGGTPPKNRPEYFQGEIPLMTVKDMRERRPTATGFNITKEGLKNCSAKLIPADTIVIATRMGLGKVVRAPFETAINQDLKALFPSAGIDKSYLELWLFSIADKLESLGTGTTVKGLRLETLRNLEFPVAPSNEQHRIVEKIETLFAQIDKGEEALREVQKLLKRYRQSILKAAVTGELTRDWREANQHKLEPASDLLARILEARRENWQGRGKYQEPLPPDTTDLPELPAGWIWTSLDHLICHLTSGSRDWKKYYGRGDGTFIMAQNVRPARFDKDYRVPVDPPENGPDAIRSEARLDDLLITIVGANTGDVCRFPLTDRRHYVCQSVALIRPSDPRLSRFLELYLSAEEAGRRVLDKFIYGAGRPHLSFEQIRSLSVPLPPLGEVTQITTVLETLEQRVRTLESEISAQVANAAALRQSILKSAFTGQLVPQEPADEPASELLARIRAERDTTAKKSSGRKVKA